MAVSLALIEQLREFETALVAEAMVAMGIPDTERFYTGSDVRLLTSSLEPMVGVALTMTADTSTPGRKPDTAELWECYAMIQESPLPVVVVMKSVGADPKRECVLGDGMAKTLKSCGSCGVVSDGGARDVERINKVGFTVYGSGTVANHASLVYRISREPVAVSGVSFATGDLVHADGEGVMVVPAQCHAGVVEACILARDAETRAHVFFRRTDKTLEEKRDFVTSLYKSHYERCRALLSKE